MQEEEEEEEEEDDDDKERTGTGQGGPEHDASVALQAGSATNGVALSAMHAEPALWSSTTPACPQHFTASTSAMHTGPVPHSRKARRSVPQHGAASFRQVSRDVLGTHVRTETYIMHVEEVRAL